MKINFLEKPICSVEKYWEIAFWNSYKQKKNFTEYLLIKILANFLLSTNNKNLMLSTILDINYQTICNHLSTPKSKLQLVGVSNNIEIGKRRKQYFSSRNFRGTNFREVMSSRNRWDLLSRMSVFVKFCDIYFREVIKL